MADNREMTNTESTEEKAAEKKPFIHLHVHTEYSLLDGASRITKGKHSPLIETCIENNMPAIAITDHGNMYGAFTMYKLARKNNVKPIIGCEFYTCSNMREKTGRNGEYNHLVLLAKNNVGYKNLVKLDSLAFTEGFYYKPRIDIDFLREHTEGLICLSACISGVIPQYLINNEYDKAKEYALMLKSMFAEGDFYIEIQDHGIPEEKKCNPLLVKLAREIGVKVVATNDAHYLSKSDAEMHDVLLCIQTGKTYDDPKRMRFSGSEFYLKDYDEMYELFSWIPEALETPFEIAEKCNVTIKKEDLMPPYQPPDGLTPAEFLRKLAYDGLADRYGTITPEIEERAEYELNIIIRMGFAEYYLIVWDFIDYARRQDIPVGKGRGSGVGSIVAYAVGITDVDPLKYNLLFERFLNPERVSNPDFDIDFCQEGRGEVKDYVVKRYGKDKVCEIITFGTLACKNAIKDVARVYNVPFDQVNKITKLIPGGKVTIDGVLGKGKPEEAIPELIELYNEDDTIKRVLDMANKVEGMPRQTGKHAAGVVICKEVISDFVPLQKNGEDITTQFQKDEVEELGMLKMDFLGLTTLTDVKKSKQYIKETTGRDIDFQVLGYEDPEVFKLLGTGETDAVFQLESPGMKRFMKDLQPSSLEDIIAGISLYRPGPMDSIPKYIAAKNNHATISYKHPLLEPILNVTYGCIVYQEQVMQVVRDLAGYTYGRADSLRRAMSKKKKDVMLAEKSVFLHGCPHKDAVYHSDGTVLEPEVKEVDGAIKRGVPEEIAVEIFDEMESFASYAFNKSHAAAYGVLAYETAYFKRYYPVQFVTAVINNRITKSDEIAKYVQYLRDTGYKVLPPNINKSAVAFKCEFLEDGTLGVRFGLTGIKNVGEQVMLDVVKEREENGDYTSLNNFLRRTAAYQINKKTIESLIKAGAFDCFGENRATYIGSYESMMLINSYDRKMQSTGQMSLFGLFGGEETFDDTDVVERVPEYDTMEFLTMEKEMLNVYMSGHPLDSYRDDYRHMFNLSYIKDLLDTEGGDEEEDETVSGDVSEIIRTYDKKPVEFGGMIADLRKTVTKSGKTMAFGKVEDLYGVIDFVMFPNVYDRYKQLLEKDNIVMINGVLEVSGRVQISVNSMQEWKKGGEETNDARSEGKEGKLYLNFTALSEEERDGVLGVLGSYRGSCPVFCQMDKALMDTNMRVDMCNALLWELTSLVGDKGVKFVEKK